MEGLLDMNVIFTTMELGAVGWFSSVLSEIHEYMFGEPIPWQYEIAKFEATRERRLLPTGWSTVWNADPKALVKRGFDKVIAVQKSLVDQCISMAMYHYPDCFYEKLERENPLFFMPIKEKWCKFESYSMFKHKKFKMFHIDNLNRHTKKEYNEMLDFLGFPKKGRPLILPVKAYRNWECYSNISRSGREQLDGVLPKIKQLYLSDVSLYKEVVIN